MSLTITPLKDGRKCYQLTLEDGENEVRVHLDGDDLMGVEVKNAALGTLYKEGDVLMGGCDVE